MSELRYAKAVASAIADGRFADVATGCVTADLAERRVLDQLDIVARLSHGRRRAKGRTHIPRFARLRRALTDPARPVRVRYVLAHAYMWAVLSILLFFVGATLLRYRTHVVDVIVQRDGMRVGLAAFAILVILGCRLRLRRAIDEWFLRYGAAHAEEFSRLAFTLQKARSVREVARFAALEIDRAIQPAVVAFYIVDEDRDQLIDIEDDGMRLSVHSALVAVVRRARRDVLFTMRHSRYRLLPHDDRAWLRTHGFVMLCPMIDSTERFVGLIAIGESRGGLRYTEDARRFIRVTTSLVTHQIENSWLREHIHDDGRHHGRAKRRLESVNERAVVCQSCGRVWPARCSSCMCGGSTIQAALPLIVDRRFRLERSLGSGGMGVVYLGIDETLHRKVAIKTLPRLSAEWASRLGREARAMASTHHPNLASIFGFEQWLGMPILIMEYLEGGSLAERLRGERLDVRAVVDLGIALSGGLERLHEMGVLHNDIKPSNIAFTRDGVPKLLDFGVSTLLDAPGARAPAELAMSARPRAGIAAQPGSWAALNASTSQVGGTLAYLSPEALHGLAPDPSFDLWSLTVVLYEALSGRHPFAEPSVPCTIANIERGAPPDVREFCPCCPPHIALLLREGLAQARSQRPSGASDISARLQAIPS